MRAAPEVVVCTRSSGDPAVHVPTRWIWVVLVLALCHAAAVASFQILSVLVSPIKAALDVSDVQYSLMQGLAVAIFASLLGVPAATIADRGNRRRVVLVGVVVWSAATLACAFARDFGELFAARMMVGLGEVFLYPSALSMIADVAPPGRMSSAIGAFGCGGPVGAAFALIGGGWLLRSAPRLAFILPDLSTWRVVFLLCGAFGALAAALLLTVSEPAHRGATDPRRAGIAQTLRYVIRHARLYAGVSGGMLALSFCVYATASWFPTMLVRDHAMSYSRAGAITGAAALVGGMLGAWACGLLSDRIESRGHDDAALQVSLGIALAFLVVVPAAVLATSLGWTAAWVGRAIPCLGCRLYWGEPPCSRSHLHPCARRSWPSRSYW
jgi:MFS family permease